MPRLILWKDEQMGKLRRDMDRLYHRVYGEFGIQHISTTLRDAPFMDLSDTDDTLIVRTKMSNIDPKDLDISVTHDTLNQCPEQKRACGRNWGVSLFSKTAWVLFPHIATPLSRRGR